MVIRVGIIGAGTFGREHARAYATVPDVRLVSVIDADPARAGALAAEFAVVPDEPDAVSIVVPVGARGRLVDDQVDAGRAVMIEKPLAASVDEARRLVDAANDRPVMVGHVLRFTEPYMLLEDRARRSGALAGGSLSRVRSASHLDRHPHDDVVGLTMIHDLDAAAWLAGRPVASVSATGSQTRGRWSVSDAELTMTDGSVWHVHARWEGADDEQVDRASIRPSAGPELAITITVGDSAVYDRALDAELAHFVEHARSRTPSERLRMEDAARAVAVADAVRLSLSQKGAVVDV